MSYAIVRVGGKQYRVEKGDSIVVDRMRADEGDKVDLEPLMYADGDKSVLQPPSEKRSTEWAVIRPSRVKPVLYQALNGCRLPVMRMSVSLS